MDTLLYCLAVFLPLLYLMVAVGYGRMFFTENERVKRWAPLLFRCALAVHGAYLVLLVIRWRQFPTATLSQALSTVAFALAVIYGVIEWRGKIASTGFWMLSFAWLFELMSALLRTPEPPYREIFHNPLFAAHTGLGLLGYTAFVAAAGYGFFFLRLYHEIKHRRFSVFFGKLPPLEVLERMMMVAMLAGFVALTGAVVSGAVWASQVFEEAWWNDPKILITLATWGFYGLALLLRRLRQWQGRQMAIASLAGFGAILFSLLCVNLLLTDVHGFR